MQQNINYYSPQDELDDELNIDFKKNSMILKSRRFLMYKVFVCVLAIFILYTFVGIKKYIVDTDLYINKTNISNMPEFNPYALEESSSGIAALAGDRTMKNEQALIMSPLVIEKVIVDNDIRIPKLFHIITTRKTGQYVPADKFIKKNISFEIQKGTNVLSVSYKNKDRELAYNVVNSIIAHYIELHREINTSKSKSDRQLIEDEYNKAKAALDVKMADYRGLPSNAASGSGTIAAMSAFSNTARRAIANLSGQVIESERSKIGIQEEAEKVSQLAKKLQWAEVVENMSESSKVLVIKEPVLPKEYEQSSPRLLKQIIFGIIFGIIFAFIAMLRAERKDKKLTYSSIGDNIIYNFDKEINTFKSILLSNNNNKIGFVCFEEPSEKYLEQLNKFKNILIIKADISEEFKTKLDTSDKIVLIEKINKTDKELYKLIKNIISNSKKEILTEILL